MKLLRVLQDREFRPVGGSRVIQPNFRLICATNINLDAALGEGKLREDLYFRINTVTLSHSAAARSHRRHSCCLPITSSIGSPTAASAEYPLDQAGSGQGAAALPLAGQRARARARDRTGGHRGRRHATSRWTICRRRSRCRAAAGLSRASSSRRITRSEEIEKLAILQTLERTRGNKRKAASILGVYRPTLYSKLKKYNLGSRERDDAPRTEKASQH